MYYSKLYKSGKSPKLVDLNKSDFMKLLNSLPFLNTRNVKTFKKFFTNEDEMNAIIDLSAAVVTQMHYRQYVSLDNLLQDTSEFFHVAVQAHGFDLTPEINTLRSPSPNARYEILVAGTQTRRIFESRVNTAIRFIRDFSPPSVNVCFSGANPAHQQTELVKTPKVSIINESAEMLAYFKECIRKKPFFPKISCATSQENEATNTQGNIQHFFEKTKLENKIDNNIFIVSSLYHLPRFAQMVESFIKTESLPVSRLTFVSADDISDMTPVKKNPHYIKAHMFEFFLELYRDQEIDEMVLPPSTLE